MALIFSNYHSNLLIIKTPSTVFISTSIGQNTYHEHNNFHHLRLSSINKHKKETTLEHKINCHFYISPYHSAYPSFLLKRHIFLYRQLTHILRVWEICESCEFLVTASCESLRVVARYCELPFSGRFSHFCYYCFIVTC